MKYINTSILILLIGIFIACDPAPEPVEVTDVRKEISKDWEGKLSDGENEEIFYVKINKDPNSDNKIIIKNFHNLGNNINVYAIVKGDNSIEIEKQSLMLGNSIIEGNGSISDSYESFNLNYSEIRDGEKTTYTANFGSTHLTKKFK